MQAEEEWQKDGARKIVARAHGVWLSVVAVDGPDLVEEVEGAEGLLDGKLLRFCGLEAGGDGIDFDGGEGSGGDGAGVGDGLVGGVGVFEVSPGGGAGGEGFGGLRFFHNFGFVIYFTLYGRTKRVHAFTNRVRGGKNVRIWRIGKLS